MSIVNIVLKFNEHGDLVSLEMRNLEKPLSAQARAWLWSYMPQHAGELDELNGHASIRIQAIEQDLSFEYFYDLYAYKVGNKKRARDHWNRLDDTTKVVALKKVREYNYYMKTVTHDKLFPERWLQQKRWENDYSVAS